MQESPKCPECGLDLPADAPLGFCPQCLMKAGMDDTRTVAGGVPSGLEQEVGPHPGEPPRQIAEYRIVREIGRGGMGIVYEAWEETLRRRVALKILPFHSLMGESHLERFRREAQAAARLHHTNIVPVFSVGCEHAKDLKIDVSGKTVFTQKVLEQLKYDTEKVINNLIKSKPKQVIHIEPIYELYSNSIRDIASRLYIQYSDYQDNLLMTLKSFEEKGKLKILDIRRLKFAANPLHEDSLIRWIPI